MATTRTRNRNRLANKTFAARMGTGKSRIFRCRCCTLENVNSR